jgi:hypothetical protein
MARKLVLQARALLSSWLSLPWRRFPGAHLAAGPPATSSVRVVAPCRLSPVSAEASCRWSSSGARRYRLGGQRLGWSTCRQQLRLG